MTLSGQFLTQLTPKTSKLTENECSCDTFCPKTDTAPENEQYRYCDNIMIVMKFGGTSVANFEAITRTIFIVGSKLDQKPVVVVSALSKVTDLL